MRILAILILVILAPAYAAEWAEGVFSARHIALEATE